jgi:cell division septation protein DedD
MSEPMERPPRPPLLGENDRPGPLPILSEESRPSGRGLNLFIAVFALVAFGGIVWYAYDEGGQTGSEETVPLIRADNAPVRMRPEKPGGLKIPHQDMQIFGRLGKNGGLSGQSVERLLPRPEKLAPQETIAVAPVPKGVTPAHVLNKPVGASKKLLLPLKSVVATNAAVTPKPAPGKPAFKSVVKTRVKPISGGRFRVQIAAFKDQTAARAAWSRVQAAHKPELGALGLTIERINIDGKGVFHRVQGGPLDEKNARAVCVGLKARNQACLVVRR